MATEHLTELSRSLSDLAAFIAEEQASVIESTQLLHEELTIALSPTALVEFVRFLRDDPQCGFISIIDVCSVI